jgi:protein translocase SecG subunit
MAGEVIIMLGKATISLIQIVLAIILIGLIILQAKGTGLGSTFGGDLSFYSTKRGAEKILFITTIIVSVLFFLFSIFGVIV